MPRAHAALLVPLALLALPGCFWGEADADMFFKVSGANADQFEDLLYPASRKEAWLDIFGARPVVCSNGEADCGIDETERSDLVDLYLPYKTSNGRGLITQKGDLPGPGRQGIQRVELPRRRRAGLRLERGQLRRGRGRRLQRPGGRGALRQVGGRRPHRRVHRPR